MRVRDLPALTRLLKARSCGGATGRHARLLGTYFDTPQLALAKQGVVLRVREQDGHFIQSVKSADAAAGGALVRGEWEDPIAAGVPDPHAPESGRFIPAKSAGRLRPLFRTDIARRTMALSPAPETLIEAAIDQGHVCTLGRSAKEPICEIELELKRGDAAALYDIALELLAVAPVRLERRSKSARGYRLAAATAPAIVPFHAAAVDLNPDMTGHQTIRLIGRSCTEQIVRNEAAVLAGMAEGIHQMRVGVRRLRAILAAFAPMLPERQRRLMSSECRWLASALGVARNLDVFVGDLVIPAQKRLGDIRGIKALRDAVVRRRADAYAEAAAVLRSPRYTGLVLRLMRWWEPHGWPEQASGALDNRIIDIAPGILDRRREVAMRRAAGFAKLSPERRHELRIALKKLRYAAEMLGQLYDAGERSGFLKRVKQLQEELGNANDLCVAREIVAELERRDGGFGAIADAGRAVLDWHAQRLAPREPRIAGQFAQFLESAPFWSNSIRGATE